MPHNATINPKTGQPPMCSDKAALQWHRDPYDSTSPEFDVPPHWMILWPLPAGCGAADVAASPCRRWGGP